MPGKAIIKLQGVSFAFKDGKTLFSGVTAAIAEESFTLVRGPSGSGKTTLLRIFCRLEEPSAGTLFLDERPYEHWPAEELRRQVHYMQQTPTVLPGDVRSNLLAAFSFKANAGLEKPNDAEMAAGMARLMLGDVDLDRQAQTLSVGQRQRICLLRALLLQPRVLLMDEPTSALDDQSRLVVEETAEAFSLEPGKAVVMISHHEFKPKRVQPRVLAVGHGETRRP